MCAGTSHPQFILYTALYLTVFKQYAGFILLGNAQSVYTEFWDPVIQTLLNVSKALRSFSKYTITNTGTFIHPSSYFKVHHTSS